MATTHRTSTVKLPSGDLPFKDTGQGRVVVFLHGLLTNGGLWRHVVDELAGECRCIVPELPLGAHASPVKRGTDLTLQGLGQMVASFLDALDLNDVILVGNDTGGALCQMVVANHPGRVTGLVLTNCDMLENYLPPLRRPLQIAARFPGFSAMLGSLLRRRSVQRMATALVSKRQPVVARLEATFGLSGRHPAIRRDLVEVLRNASSRGLIAASRRFSSFPYPVLILWSADDKLYPIGSAERVAQLFPVATLLRIEGSRAQVPEDRPEMVVEAVRRYLAGQLASQGED